VIVSHCDYEEVGDVTLNLNSPLYPNSDNNIDPRDHPFILGATTPGTRPLNEVIAEARANGQNVDKVSEKWMEDAKLKRFPELVEEALAGS